MFPKCVEEVDFQNMVEKYTMLEDPFLLQAGDFLDYEECMAVFIEWVDEPEDNEWYEDDLYRREYHRNEWNFKYFHILAADRIIKCGVSEVVPAGQRRLFNEFVYYDPASDKPTVTWIPIMWREKKE